MATMMKKSIFYANYGRYLNLFRTPRILLGAETVLKEVSELKKLYKKISQNIKYQ